MTLIPPASQMVIGGRPLAGPPIAIFEEGAGRFFWGDFRGNITDLENPFQRLLRRPLNRLFCQGLCLTPITPQHGA